MDHLQSSSSSISNDSKFDDDDDDEDEHDTPGAKSAKRPVAIEPGLVVVLGLFSYSG